MTRRTKGIIVAACVGLGGPLATGVGFKAYFSSASYRHRVEDRLTEYFQLPCNIESMSRGFFTDSAFSHLELWLPDRRDRVFHCDRAIWDENCGNRPGVTELELSEGVLALGTENWKLEDYRTLLESSLRHDFNDLKRVVLENFDITFRRRTVLLTVRDVGGTIVFEKPDEGVASLQAYVLNGARVREPIRIHSRFLTHTATLVNEFLLEVPEIPLSALGLDAALGGAVSHGLFSGRVAFVDAMPQPRVTFSGRLFDVDLAELTQRLPTGPLHGAAELILDEAQFAGSVPVHVRGRASLSKMPLSDFATMANMPNLSGVAALNISELDIEGGHIRRLVINGRVEGVELSDVLQRFAPGAATGRLSVIVNALRIEQDRIVTADIDIAAVPPGRAKATIDRDLLLGAGEKLSGFTWPDALPRSLLPEKLEYVQCGLRLLVTDNQLRVVGTHGRGSDTILTIRALGTTFGLVKAWSGTTDLSPWVDALLARISTYDPRRVRSIFAPKSATPP